MLNIPAPPRPWEMFLAPPIVAEQGECGGEGEGGERMRSGEWMIKVVREVWDAIDCEGATTTRRRALNQKNEGGDEKMI